jgi:hypothetical protein
VVAAHLVDEPPRQNFRTNFPPTDVKKPRLLLPTVLARLHADVVHAGRAGRFRAQPVWFFDTNPALDVAPPGGNETSGN